MKSTELFYHEVFVDILGKDGITIDQSTKHNIFFCEINVKINFCTKFNLFKPRKKKLLILNRVLLPNMIFSE